MCKPLHRLRMLVHLRLNGSPEPLGCFFRRHCVAGPYDAISITTHLTVREECHRSSTTVREGLQLLGCRHRPRQIGDLPHVDAVPVAEEVHQGVIDAEAAQLRPTVDFPGVSHRDLAASSADASSSGPLHRRPHRPASITGAQADQSVTHCGRKSSVRLALLLAPSLMFAACTASRGVVITSSSDERSVRLQTPVWALSIECGG